MKKHNFRKVVYPILLLCILIINIFLVKFNVFKKVEPVLIGDLTSNINVYTDFKNEGLELKVDDKLIDPSDYTVKENNNVDTLHIGEYKENYVINYRGKDYKVTRTVNVIDNEAPTLETTTEVVYSYYCDANQNDSIDYTAYDNYDGNISDKVTVNKTDTNVVLSVSDSSNNTTTKTLNYELTGKVPPVITLNSKSTIYVKNGSAYTEPGVKVTDGCGKEIDASSLTTTGSVDTSKNGTYEITYSITYDDMTTTATRKVKVYTPSTSSTSSTTSGDKVVYLTFDDGPGVYTSQFLDILDQYNVKATFFVTNQFPKYQNLIAEEAKRGHAIAVHTYTHQYSIYSSIENYVKDFNDMNNIIEAQTGKKTTMFRFPGGSSNTVSKNYSIGIMSSLASYMQGQGYQYYDWNVSSEDASGAGSDRIYNAVVNGVHSHNTSIVLCHDIHKTTLNALPRILETLTSEGYTFKVLTPDSPKAHHGINN